MTGSDDCFSPASGHLSCHFSYEYTVLYIFDFIIYPSYNVHTIKNPKTKTDVIQLGEKSYLQERHEDHFKQMAIDPFQFPRCFPDLAYGEESDEQKLDVFLPGTKGPYPLVVFVHGGGWYFGGRREECISSIFKIVSQGYAVATVDYRLAPENMWPAQIYDVKRALRYLIAHSGELSLDSSKIVLWGNSAGAHLIQIAAATHAGGKLDYITEKSPLPICGIISWYGVTNLSTAEQQLHPDTPVNNDRTMRDTLLLLLGFDPYENREGAMEACSFPYIGRDFPPALIQHGREDKTVSYLQSQELYDRISEKCGRDRAILEIFDGAVHGDQKIKSDQNINRCVDFLDALCFPDGRRACPRTPLPQLKLVPSTCEKVDPYEPS